MRDSRSAFELVQLGVHYLGFHVLDMIESEQASLLAAVNKRLRAIGFDGGVCLTKVDDIDWIVQTAVDGLYRYVQLHRDVSLECIEDLSERLGEHGASLIQVVDPSVHSAAYVADVLEYADYVLYDNYIGGTGRRIVDQDLERMPMDRAFIAGGVNDVRARDLKARFSPHAIDVQSWVKRPDKSKDLGRVATLVEIVGDSR